jgi:cell wall assembly regulator SMI1
MPTLRENWKRIVRWHAENVRDDEGLPADRSLPAGASAPDIDQAEQAIGLRFPADLRASYLLHDGSAGYGIFPWGYSFLSLAELVHEWQRNRKLLAHDWATSPSGPIRPVHWSTKWIPVGSNQSGDFDCIDLDPAPGGTIGQMIAFNHEVGPTRVAAAGIGAWVAEYADRLEAGIYRYDPDSLWVCRDDGQE